jgi:copper homeostasis protein CutC
MIAIERKLLEMSGQVSQVLEGMDKLNVKVKSFMQQLLACREDGVNVRNLKTIVATINIKEVDVTTRTRCRNPTLAKCGGEAQHLEKLEVWSPPGLPNVQSSTARGKTPCIGVFLVSLERS